MRQSSIWIPFALCLACSEGGGPGSTSSGGSGAVQAGAPSVAGGGMIGQAGNSGGAPAGGVAGVAGTTPTAGSAGMPGTAGNAAGGGGGGEGGTTATAGRGGAPLLGGAAGSSGQGQAAGVGGSSGSPGGSAGAKAMQWLPSWATSIQRTEAKNLPMQPFAGKTLRQFVWPTFSGTQIRLQLSNEKGSAPVQIQKVSIAKAKTIGSGQIDTGTAAAFTFSGTPSVTIPAQETAWSDPLAFDLEKIEATAITLQLGTEVPAEITGHPGARMNSYIGQGDVVAEALTGTEKIERWYFINAIEVMAPPDAFAIAALGDSITDGYGIHDQFARWTDFLTLAIDKDPALADKRSVLNFGMGANNLTVSDADQDAGVLRFERDVLGRDKIKWLVVLEGVNDIVAGVQAQPIIDAYKQIITKAKAKGIRVYGSPITPMGSDNAVRNAVNQWVRTAGEYDEVVDFDMALRDPNNQHVIRSEYRNDDLHPTAAGYEAIAKSLDLALFRQ